MFELPDRRALLIFSITAFAVLVNILIPNTSVFSMPAEIALYLTFIFSGLAFAALDLRDGFCMNRPSINRSESPILFWSEVLASCFVIYIGAYKLWQII